MLCLLIILRSQLPPPRSLNIRPLLLIRFPGIILNLRIRSSLFLALMHFTRRSRLRRDGRLHRPGICCIRGPAFLAPRDIDRLGFAAAGDGISHVRCLAWRGLACEALGDVYARLAFRGGCIYLAGNGLTSHDA